MFNFFCFCVKEADLSNSFFSGAKTPPNGKMMPKRARADSEVPQQQMSLFLVNLIFQECFFTGLLDGFFTRQEYFSLMLTSQKGKLFFRLRFEAGTLFSFVFPFDVAPPLTVRNMRTNSQYWDAEIMNNRPRLKHIECDVQAPNPCFDMNALPPCATSLHLTRSKTDGVLRAVRLLPSKQTLLNLLELDLTKIHNITNPNWGVFCANLPNLQVLRTDYFVPCFEYFQQLRVLECTFQGPETPIKLPPNLIELRCRCRFSLLLSIIFPESLVKLKIGCRAPRDDVSFFSQNWLPRGLKHVVLRGLTHDLGCPPPDWLPPRLEILKLESSCKWKISDASVFPTRTLHTLSFGGSFSSQGVVDQFGKLIVLKCKFESLGSIVFPTVASLTVNYCDFDQKIVNSGLRFILSLFPNATSLTLQSNQNILDIASEFVFPKIKTLELLCEVVSDELHFRPLPFPFLENLTCSVDIATNLLLQLTHFQTLKLWPDCTDSDHKDQDSWKLNLTNLTTTIPSFRKLSVRTSGELRKSIPNSLSFLAKGKNDYLDVYFNF